MASVSEHRLQLTAVDKASAVLKSVDQSLARLQTTTKSLVATLGGAVGVGGLTFTLDKMLAAATEAERAQNRLEGVLRATGYSAGISKRELNAMADEMARLTEFDDESLRGAQSTLLKFGNITGDVFREALKVSADLAAFMGTNVPEAAQIVGRALQSPTEGLKGFAQQFGKLTDAEEKAINELARAGKTIEAQNLVLEIARRRVGGLAETMNTGLYGATRSVKKEWDELLEAMGKSDAIGGRAESVLRGLYTLLHDIRKELEGERTPLSQLMAELFNATAFVGSMGVFGNIGGDTMPWTVHSGVKVPRLGSGPGLTEEERLKRWEDDFKAQQGRWTSNPKLGGGTTKAPTSKEMSAERIAQLQLEGEEEFAKATAEAWKFWTDQQLKDQQYAADEQKKMWKAVFDSIDDEQERAIEEGRILLEGLNAEAKRGEELANDLGLTFVSAFEDAIVGGKGLREILKGLEQDILRIVTRRLLTEPLADAITGAVKGSDFFKTIASAIGGWFGGGKADGGPVWGGTPYLVGERGPELFVPRQAGNIVPNDEMRSRRRDTPMVVINVTAPDPNSFRSASAQIVADMTTALEQGRRFR